MERMYSATEAQTQRYDNQNKYLTFSADRQLYGIPISDVVQIIQIQEVTEVPGFPEYAKCIISLRGETTPLIDMRIRLNKLAIDHNERTYLIVTKIHDVRSG